MSEIYDSVGQKEPCIFIFKSGYLIRKKFPTFFNQNVQFCNWKENHEENTTLKFNLNIENEIKLEILCKIKILCSILHLKWIIWKIYLQNCI